MATNPKRAKPTTENEVKPENKVKPKNKINWAIIVSLVSLYVTTIGILVVQVNNYYLKYAEAQSENIELKNQITSLKKDNVELTLIKTKYFDLLIKLLSEGKLNVKELSESLPPQEIAAINNKITPVPTATQPTIKPGKLIEIIVSKQNERVKKSIGEYAYNSFTDKDLEEFKKQDIPSQVKSELKKDNEFLDVVLAIKAMNPTARQKLLEEGVRKHKRTFEEAGGIDPAGETQTKAGQEAERLIAEAIVNEVRELIKLPEEELKKLQTEN